MLFFPSFLSASLDRATLCALVLCARPEEAGLCKHWYSVEAILAPWAAACLPTLMDYEVVPIGNRTNSSDDDTTFRIRLAKARHSTGVNSKGREARSAIDAIDAAVLVAASGYSSHAALFYPPTAAGLALDEPTVSNKQQEQDELNPLLGPSYGERDPMT